MSNESPYSHLFQLFGQPPEQNVASINAEAFQQMIALLSRPVEAVGRCMLLRAPRAGYGKSHLLSRVQHQLGGSHEFVLLQPADGYRVDAAAALTDVLAKLVRILPGSGGLTVLDILARKLLAMGLEPLVRSGEVPCQDRESALSALHNRPVETFDFHHPIAVTAHWARDNYEQLGPRLVVEIAELIGAPMREVGFWVDVMFRYAVTPLDQPGRTGMLMVAVANSAAVSMTERLSTLLKMLSQLQRVVLVADELEGMSANEEAALRLAAFVTALRHGAVRVDIIISVNDDVWENAFLPRLSDGLKDRLSEAEVRLGSLTREQALQLLQSRNPTASSEQLSTLLLGGGNLYSRGVLRAASAAWMSVPVMQAAVTKEVASANEMPLANTQSPQIEFPVTEPIMPQAAEPVISPIAQPVVAPVIAPVAQPVIQPVAQPVIEPVVAAVIPPVVAPVAEPVIPQLSAHLEEWVELSAPVIHHAPAPPTPQTEFATAIAAPEIAPMVPTPLSAPSPPEEVATFSWEKYGASPLTGEIGQAAPVVERPVFVPPAMMESTATRPAYPPFQRVQEPEQAAMPAAVDYSAPVAEQVPVRDWEPEQPAREPEQPAREPEQPAREPEQPALAPWWAERSAAHANSVFQEKQQLSDMEGSSSPFSFATSTPPTDGAAAPESRIEPAASPFDFASLTPTAPQSPTAIPAAPEPRIEPTAPPFDFSTLEEVVPQVPTPAAIPNVAHSWPVTPTAAPTGGEWTAKTAPSIELEDFEEETMPHPPLTNNKQPELAPVAFESTTESISKHSKEIDRVDELLKQFRDRYGRS